jgi:hypothetical protein
MQALIRRWEAAADRRSIFLSCYMLMTGNMLAAIDAGEFDDAGWVNILLHRFADYYFDALAAYEQDSPATPAVWRLAFDAARRPQTQVLQNLLLGVSAHINYDLVLTLVDMLEREWAGLSQDQRGRRYADHCHVNQVIGRTVDSVQDTIVERLAPALDIVDKLLGPLDEWMASRLITHWRDQVWQNAVLLMETPHQAERERLRYQVEAASLQRADAILLDGSPLVLKNLL